MQLYWFRTMNPRKACATARLTGSEIDFVEVAGDELTSADFLGINPNGKLPALVDGDLRLWESAAICAYLAGKAGSPLWPADLGAQVEVLRWITWTHDHWQPAVGVYYFENYIRDFAGFGAPDPEALEAAAPQVAKVAPVLDAHLADRPFLTGAAPTIADLICAAMLPDWQQLKMPLAPYANLRRWHDDRLMALPHWADPWPT